MKKIIVLIFVLYMIFILHDGVVLAAENKSQSLPYVNRPLPSTPRKMPSNVTMPVMPVMRNVPQVSDSKLPNIPGRTGIVGVPMTSRLQNFQNIGNAIGRITEISMEGDNNVGRIAVKKEFSEMLVRINISGKTEVIKKAENNKEPVKMDVKDLKTGGIVSAMYKQEITGELTATFITILSEDDLKAFMREEEEKKNIKEMLGASASPTIQSNEVVDKEKSNAISPPSQEQ